MKKNRQLTEIPKEFWSFHENGPFKKCIDCDRNLLEENCEYVIEKAIRSYSDFNTSDVIFDYAICTTCLKKIHDDFSKESLEKLQEYFTERMNMESHLQKLNESKGDIKKLIDECLITHKSKSKTEEYQIFAHCIGDKINLENPPYMLSNIVMNEISELLSDETRNDLDRFFDKHFTPDPSLMEPLPRIILV